MNIKYPANSQGSYKFSEYTYYVTKRLVVAVMAAPSGFESNTYISIKI
jgi:hypothetical protein